MLKRQLSGKRNGKEVFGRGEGGHAGGRSEGRSVSKTEVYGRLLGAEERLDNQLT